MSGGFPAVTGSQLVRAFRRAGFQLARIQGSHHILVHPDGRRVSVPVHASRTLGQGLVHQLLKGARISPEELRDLL